MPLYRLGYKGYTGTDPLVSAFDEIANFFLSSLFLEHMTFLFAMLLFIAFAQALAERRMRFLCLTGLIMFFISGYLLVMFSIWMFESTEGLWYLHYTLIADFLAIVFFIIFLFFSFIRIVTHRFQRYFWPYIVSCIILIVECGMYQFFYNDITQLIAFFVVIFVSIPIWFVLLSPPIRNRSILT